MMTKNTLGRIYTDLGQKMRPSICSTKSCPTGNPIEPAGVPLYVHQERLFLIGEATTLSNMGRVYDNLGDRQKALDFLNQALPIWEQSGGSAGQAGTLDSFGRTYSSIGDPNRALDYYNRALHFGRLRR